MFQIAKDRKAKEEELARQEAALEAMRQAVAWVADSNSKAQAALEEMEENQESLDDALNQVVSMVRRIQEDQSARAKEEVWIRQQLQEFCQSLREREKAWGEGTEQARRQQQSLRELAGQCQDGEGALQGLRAWAGQLGEQLTQAQEQMKAMEAQGRSMGILSLNSAIEAARMGETGRKFVTASEEVQSCAGEYRQAAEQLGQELLKMQEGLAEAAQGLAELEERLSGNRAGMEALQQELDEGLKQLGCIGQMTEEGTQEPGEQGLGSGRLEEVYGRLEQAGGIAAGQEEFCKQILQQMEAAGESYMKEQRLLEQLRASQGQIRDAIKEREEWG